MSVPTENSDIKSWRPLSTRIIQNFHLIWFNENINQDSDTSYHDIITKLRAIVNTVNILDDIDECIDLITDIEETKVFLISSKIFDPIKMSIIHDIPQISSIYIFPEHQSWHEQGPKVKDVFPDIITLCEVLKSTAHQCDQNSISISFISTSDDESTRNLDQLDASFMYTQLLEEILLTINFEQKHIDEFVDFYRERCDGNVSALRNIGEFQKEYHDQSPIWWYTSPNFIYSMLNRGLRMMQVDVILKMGFFIQDLHKHINALHIKQNHRSLSFMVYRGQGLSHSDFAQLHKTEGGLIAFNSFLSTSLDREMSFAFAESNSFDPKLIGVLFQITIDPSTASTSFADIRDVSNFYGEKEVLFPMHSVFRIRNIQPSVENNQIWQVDLTLTNDNDPQLHALTEHIRNESYPHQTGWYRLAYFLIRLGELDKAEQLYIALLQQTTDEDDQEVDYFSLGQIWAEQGRYTEAILFYEKILEILREHLSPTDSTIGAFYNNIGTVYQKMGNFAKALSYLEKALKISEKISPPDDSSLARDYANIGTVYDEMGRYSQALFYHEKAFEIFQKILPSNHPDLSIVYNNLGYMYQQIGDYSKALSFHRQACEICQKILPRNHPHLAISYDNIAPVYDQMHNDSEALLFRKKALEIEQNILSPNHPRRACSYANIGAIYERMGEYTTVLSSYEKALEIFQKIYVSDHPNCAIMYDNIGSAYRGMGVYWKALSSYEKALEIFQKTLHANHPYLITVYDHIATIYQMMDDYPKALSYYEKTIEICTNTLSPEDHPYLIVPYSNIGIMCRHRGDYSNALSYLIKALTTRQKTLPSDHLMLAESYNNIGLVYNDTGEYQKALTSHEQALEIGQKQLSPNHPSLIISYIGIQTVYRKIGDYPRALAAYEKVLEIKQHTLSPDDPDLAMSFREIGLMNLELGRNSSALASFQNALEIYEKILSADDYQLADLYGDIGLAHRQMGEHSKARLFFERALTIAQRSLPADHPDLQTFEEYIKSLEE